MVHRAGQILITGIMVELKRAGMRINFKKVILVAVRIFPADRGGTPAMPSRLKSAALKFNNSYLTPYNIFAIAVGLMAILLNIFCRSQTSTDLKF